MVRFRLSPTGGRPKAAQTAVFLLFSLLGSAPTRTARAEQQTVEVQGVASIVNNDVGMARDKALDDAKRKAVEQVAGARIDSQSVTENFQLVEERIYARASGFVKNFEIKTEYKNEGTYVVKIKATVDAGAVAENLDQLFKVKPRVIVLIAEQNVGAATFSYWWGQRGFASEMDILQSSLIGMWQPKGFKFIEPGLLQGKLKLSKAMNRADLGNDDALTLSKNADADVAIVGKVVVTDAGPVMEGVKMRSFHAVGALRVLSVSTGEILAVGDDSAVAPHIDGNQGGRLAIKALAEKISESLQKKILEKWTSDAANAQSLEMVVGGVSKSAIINAFKKSLKTEVRGVESVDERRRQKQKAFLEVKYRGDAASLAQLLEETKFAGFSVEISEINKSKIVLNLVAQ